MKIVMKKNLGSRDAAPLGVDYRKFGQGMEVAAEDAVAEVLVKRGLATLVDEPEKEVRAVPPAPVKAVPAVSSVKGK